MKILLASDTYHPHVNGAAYFTYRLAHALADDGHTVAVLAPATLLRSTVEQEGNVKVLRLTSWRLPVYADFQAVLPLVARKQIRKHILDFAPDVIHIQNHFLIGREVVKVAKRYGIAIIGTNHFMPENLLHYGHMPKALEHKVAKWGWQDFARVYNKLDAIAAPTKTAAVMAEKWLHREVVPVSCGLDLKCFSPDLKGDNLRERFHLPKGKYLLSVGRLDPEKRIEVIIGAMPEIVRQTNAHLLIAGTGKLRTYLEDYTAELGMTNRVSFLGFVPDEDLPNLYALADIFVTSGIAELQSLVTMEAMATGKPVLAVNAQALPELAHDGENGYLFEDGDSATLARRAVEILKNDDLRKKMGAESLRIMVKHDMRHTLDQYMILYKQALIASAARMPMEKKSTPYMQRFHVVVPLVSVGPIALVAILLWAAFGLQSTAFAQTAERRYVAVREKVSTYVEQYKVVKAVEEWRGRGKISNY